MKQCDTNIYRMSNLADGNVESFKTMMYLWFQGKLKLSPDGKKRLDGVMAKLKEQRPARLMC